MTPFLREVEKVMGNIWPKELYRFHLTATVLFIDDIVLGLELCGMLVTGNYAWQRQLLHSPGHAGNTIFSGS